jgi:lipopolysaccharide export system protein LptA
MRIGGLSALRRTALLAVVLAAGAAGTAGAEETPSGKGQNPQLPVRVTAESAEYFNAEGLVVFTGKVVAVQADTTITAERMEVRFTQAPTTPDAKPAGIGEAAPGQRIASITALQSVTFRQVDPETRRERYATGEKGVYDADLRVVTLTGAPRLWEDKNVIVGEEMVFHLEDRKVVVRGKVNLTVYPDDAKKGSAAPR